MAEDQDGSASGSGPGSSSRSSCWSFALYSLVGRGDHRATTAATLDKEWQIFPPEWECHGRPGFG